MTNEAYQWSTVTRIFYRRYSSHDGDRNIFEMIIST